MTPNHSSRPKQYRRSSRAEKKGRIRMLLNHSNLARYNKSSSALVDHSLNRLVFSCVYLRSLYIYLCCSRNRENLYSRERKSGKRKKERGPHRSSVCLFFRVGSYVLLLLEEVVATIKKYPERDSQVARAIHLNRFEEERERE